MYFFRGGVLASVNGFTDLNSPGDAGGERPGAALSPTAPASPTRRSWTRRGNAATTVVRALTNASIRAS